jgi:heme/copper-type cytochrome/quinol oxidase subunit 2
MFFGGVEMLVLTVVFWLVSVWVFYMVIKAAVRNGILEAEARRRGPREQVKGDGNP